MNQQAPSGKGILCGWRIVSVYVKFVLNIGQKLEAEALLSWAAVERENARCFGANAISVACAQNRFQFFDLRP